MATKRNSVKRNLLLVNKAWPAIYAGTISALFTQVFYPGFMSYDTLHALRSARGEVTDSMWPPMVSYVWRAIDEGWPNPYAMFLFQVTLLLVSITLVVRKLSSSSIVTTITLPILLIVPVVAGTLAVIWKDVLTSGFLWLGFLIALYVKRENKLTYTVIIRATLSIIFIFFAVSTRHNMIAGAIPIILYLSWKIIGTKRVNLKNITLKVVSVFILLSSVTYGSKVFLDNFSLPSFNRISGADSFTSTNQILDLAGASLCANVNYISLVAPQVTSLSQLASIYDPRHVNLSTETLNKVTSGPEEITSKWLDVAFENPVCLVAHKAQMSYWMSGLNPGEQYLITAPAIDPNEFGIELAQNKFRDTLVQNIVNQSFLPIFRPWFLALLASIGMILARKSFALSLELQVLYTSGVLYAAGLFLMGNAADARLLFHSNVSFIVVTVITFAQRFALTLRGRKY